MCNYFILLSIIKVCMHINIICISFFLLLITTRTFSGILSMHCFIFVFLPNSKFFSLNQRMQQQINVYKYFICV